MILLKLSSTIQTCLVQHWLYQLWAIVGSAGVALGVLNSLQQVVGLVMLILLLVLKHEDL